MSVSRLRCALLGGAAMLISSPAIAQTTRPAPTGPATVADTAAQTSTTPATPGDSTQAQAPDAAATADIVVTAQNRVQRAQDVPIALTVVSGEALRSAGVTDFTSVTRVSPAIQVTSDTTNTRVSVRGVGSISNNEASDQSIAVDIDGEYINRPTVLNSALFDIDRVEVLRGPQGTLYGRNTTGGAVNFITRKPGDAFAVNASATYGSYNQVIVDGGVDVPLGGVGAIRLSGIYSYHEGYTRATNTPISLPYFSARPERRSGSDRTRGGRASLRLTPARGLTIDAAVEHVQQDFIPETQAFADLNAAGNAPGPGCSGNGYVEVGPATPGTQCIPKNTNFLSGINRFAYPSPITGVGIFHQTTTAVRGRLAYDFGPATFTYTGGYRTSRNSGGNALSPAYFFTNFGATVKTQSHEARFNGKIGGIDWQTGAFYFKEDQDTDGGLYNPFIGPPTGALGSYITYFQHPTHTQSWSVFGQVEVPIIGKLTAVGGLRYTKDTRSADYRNYGFLFNSGPIRISGTPAQDLLLHYSGDKLTYLAGLNYKPDRDTLIYAKVSTGYKAGGFDPVSTFKAETNTAYEGGVKLNFGRNRTSIFNLAGFYYDYTNLQNDVLLNSVTGEQTFNAGKATIWGAEAETTIHLSRDDTFTASFNYLHAKYDDFLASYAVIDFANPFNHSLLPADNPNLRGNYLPQAPEVIIGVGYDHTFQLGAAGTVTLGAFSRFKSRYFLDIFNYRDSQQRPFTSTDLNIEYKPRGGAFSIQGFARNIENVRPVVYAGYTAAGPDNVYNWQFGPPRTYGVRVAVNF